MRELSTAIKNVLAQDWAETKDVVIITIPEQFGAIHYDAVTLYFGNGDGIFIDGIQYENKLREISAIKFSLNKTPDNASFVIENVSRSLGFTITDFQRALDGAKVVIKRAFRIDTTTWESDIMFVGYISDTRIDQQQIEVSLRSDMNRRGTSVAGNPLTQRCILKFNVNGSGVGPFCGWQTSQPGDPLACDKGLDTVNGCQSHGNQHRFGGVPPFTALDTSNGYDTGAGGGGGGGWGEGSGGGWCVGEHSFILAEKEGKKVWVKAHELQSGDFLVSINDEGQFVPTRLVKATFGNVDKLYTVTTRNGYSLSCSGEHGIMQKYTQATAVETKTLFCGDEVLVYDFDRHIHFKDEIIGYQISNEKSLVVSLSLESPYHLFMASNTEDGAIVSHNLKPIFTDYDGIGRYSLDLSTQSNY
jgi:hypothetical protein